MKIYIKHYDVEIESTLNEDSNIESVVDVMLGSLRALGWQQSTIDSYIIELARHSIYGKSN
jgi:hypothetical protein